MTVENSIKFIRLNNGEDLVASTTYIPEKDSKQAYYIVNNPMKIIYMPSGASGRPGMSISMIQWVFSRMSKTTEFDIADRDVLFTSDPTESLIEFYNDSVTKFTEDPNVGFDEDNDEYDEEDEYEDEEDGMQMLHDLIEQLKSSKKTLH